MLISKIIKTKFSQSLKELLNGNTKIKKIIKLFMKLTVKKCNVKLNKHKKIKFNKPVTQVYQKFILITEAY